MTESEQRKIIAFASQITGKLIVYPKALLRRTPKKTEKCHWPFVSGTHSINYIMISSNIFRWPVNSPHKGQWRGAVMFFFDLPLIKLLCKKSWGWWFETPSHPFWRHCIVKGISSTLRHFATIIRHTVVCLVITVLSCTLSLQKKRHMMEWWLKIWNMFSRVTVSASVRVVVHDVWW